MFECVLARRSEKIDVVAFRGQRAGLDHALLVPLANIRISTKGRGDCEIGLPTWKTDIYYCIITKGIHRKRRRLRLNYAWSSVWVSREIASANADAMYASR